MKKKSSQTPWKTPPEGSRYTHRPLKVIRKAYKDGLLRHVRLETGRVLIHTDWLDTYLLSYEVESSTAGDDLLESMKVRD